MKTKLLNKTKMNKAKYRVKKGMAAMRFVPMCKSHIQCVRVSSLFLSSNPTSLMATGSAAWASV